MLPFAPILSFLLLILCNYSFQNDVVGCGGFVKSAVSLNYDPIKIKLYTSRGIIKYTSDCAPNNGYYFIPLYDHGEYVLRIDSPRGWSFEPTEINFNFDGKNDICSKQTDINFVFNGFSIFGKVFSANSVSGPKGVQVTLISKASNSAIKQNVTQEDGFYFFHQVLPGQYIVEASHKEWKIEPSRVTLEVTKDNINQEVDTTMSSRIQVLGYSATGQVVSDGQPIHGVQFALFGSDALLSGKISGCDTTKSSFAQNIKSSSGFVYICQIVSNSDGVFKFELLPVGKYILYSFYSAQNIRFEVEPSMQEFEILHDNFNFPVTFEIGGFTVSGRVVNKLKLEDKIENAQITIHDKSNKSPSISVVAQGGKFTINNMKTAHYIIETVVENYHFDPIESLISPNSPTIPVITPSQYRICGKLLFKNTELAYENMELMVIEKKSKVVQQSIPIHGDSFCLYLSGGTYQLQIQTEYLNLKFLPDSLELTVNQPKMDIVFEQMTSTISGLVKLKSSIGDEPNFITINLSDGKTILKTLSTKDLKSVSSDQFKFTFENILPGEHVLSLGGSQMSLYCWENHVISVNTQQGDVIDVLFKQRGFLLQISLSHASDFKVIAPSGKTETISKEEIPKERFIKHCVTENGIYQIIPSGCHIFSSPSNENFIFDTQTMAGQIISLTATQHLVTATVRTSVNISDLSINVIIKSNDGEDSRKIELKEAKVVDSSTGSEVYEYSIAFYEKSMADIGLEPESSQLLFKPTAFQFQLKDECYQNVVTFYGRHGVFVTGQVSESIDNVLITVWDNGTNEVLHETVTDVDGYYRAGPFDDDIQLRIEATKEGFIFLPLSNKLGYFDVKKLSTISATIVDENNQPLNDVLVSISGGENNFRKNSFVTSDGKLTFGNLHPGQYFIRFLRKEYEFEPSSRMIELHSGEHVETPVVGRKVAFSCFGLVDSLSGEPEVGIVVEAVGVRNVLDNSSVICSELQEEAVSENDGTYRILGLLSDCQYVIRLKIDETDEHKSIIRESIPRVYSVRVQNRDLTDMRFIVLFKNFQTDLSASLQTEEKYLNSLTVELFQENDSYKPVFRQSLSSPFLFLPSVPMDNSEYTLRIESNLDSKVYLHSPIVRRFRVNQNFIHLNVEFRPKLRADHPGLGFSEHDIPSNSIYSIVLFVILAIAYYHKQVIEYTQSSSLYKTYIQSRLTNSRGNVQTDNGSTIKKKIKPKKN